MEAAGLRERITEAIGYWEPRRVVYNAVLVLVVLGYFAADYPGSKAALNLDEVLVVFVLAVLANVAYCAAYVPDVFAQTSGFRDQWRKYRWIPFAIGVTFAGVITRFFAMGLFGNSRQ
jgi:uncharacterized membrane protein YfcA